MPDRLTFEATAHGAVLLDDRAELDGAARLCLRPYCLSPAAYFGSDFTSASHFFSSRLRSADEPYFAES